MKLKDRMTLKLQLILLFISLLTAVIAFIMGFINIYVYDIVLEDTEQERLNIFNMIENDINEYIKNLEKITYSILLNSQVKEFSKRKVEFSSDDIVLRQQISKNLDNFLRLCPEMNSIIIRTIYDTQIGMERTFSYDKSGSPIKVGQQQDFPLGAVSRGWSFIQFDSYPTRNNSNKNGLSFFNRFYSGDRTYYTDITINLNESGFRELYKKYYDRTMATLYMCDSKGFIFSDENTVKIRTTTEFHDKIDQNKRNGSFVYSFEDKGKQQVIYQVMMNTGWIIVEEVPLALYTKKIDTLKRAMMVVLLISILGAGLLSVMFIKKVTTPLKLLIDAMAKMRQGDVGYQIENHYKNDFHEIIGHFNEMSHSIEEQIQNNKRISDQKLQYAMAALTSQINPHFIFNTINMIRWMAITQKAKSIQSALSMLLALLKPLFKDKVTVSSLKDEIDYAQNYISLINLRYSANVELVCNLPQELLERMVPRFVLQPLIENCVEHGFQPERNNGKITINCEQSDCLLLFIEDNGNGALDEDVRLINERLRVIDETVENGDKIGIANVHARLRLKYGEGYGLTYSKNSTGGITVTIKIP